MSFALIDRRGNRYRRLGVTELSESELRELFGVVRIDVKHRRCEILEAVMFENAEFWGVAALRPDCVEPLAMNLASRSHAEIRAAELRERLGLDVRVFRIVAHLSELSAPLLSPVTKG